jgi:hypothetical protein
MKFEAWMVGCTTNSRGEEQGESKPVIVNEDDNDKHNKTNEVLFSDNNSASSWGYFLSTYSFMRIKMCSFPLPEDGDKAIFRNGVYVF